MNKLSTRFPIQKHRSWKNEVLKRKICRLSRKPKTKFSKNHSKDGADDFQT